MLEEALNYRLITPAIGAEFLDFPNHQLTQKQQINCAKRL